MLQLEKDLLEIQLQVSKWKPVVDKIMNPMYGYTRLDYIQSDENTYLNTSYTPNKETVLEIGFKVSSTADNNICCSDNFGICIRDGLLCCMFGGDIISTDYVVNTDTVIELILSINGLFVNGEKILDKFNIDFNSSKELLVGAGYLDNEIQALNLKDIYYCRILDGEYYNIKSEEVDENGNLIMSVLNQVNNVEDEFTEFGGTDAEIKTTLDAVMNKTQGVSRFKDTIRNYIGAYQIIKDDTVISTNVGLWNCVDKTLYLATEGKFIDGDITLPYIELEYLQTTGTQYINTGISESSVYEFIYEFTPLQISGGNNYGSYLSGTLDNFTIGGYETLTRAYFRYRGAEKTTNISLSTSKKNIIKLIDNYFTVNGSNLVSITTSSAVGTGSSNIFICSNGSKSRITIGKVYGLKLFNNNQVLLSHLIPVIRKSDNVVCMYDKVRKIFVENAGTGTFIAGPTVKGRLPNLNTDKLLLQLYGNNITSNTTWTNLINSSNLTVSNGVRDESTNSMTFNGSSTIIDTEIAQSTLSSGYTMVLRFLPNSWTNYKGLFGLHDTGGENGIVGLQYQDGNIYFGHRNNGNNSVVVSSSKLSTNTWHVAICKFDGTYLYLYIDGIYIGKTSSNTPLTSTGNVIIGKSYNGGDRFFYGKISDILLYKRAITGGEIDYIFKNI